jgi:hypothetical protein
MNLGTFDIISSYFFPSLFTQLKFFGFRDLDSGVYAHQITMNISGTSDLGAAVMETTRSTTIGELVDE